jgi:hypothetical protein
MEGMCVRQVIETAIVAVLGISVMQAQANVNLELRPVSPAYRVNETVEVGLYAVSDDETDQTVRGIQVILAWDPLYFELLGVNNNGPYGWLMSDFYDDSALDGLNNALDDGDAYYQAVGNFDDVALATPAGLLVTTLQFRALLETPATQINIVPDLGGQTNTAVLGDPGEDLTGTLGSAVVIIDPAVDWGDLALDAPDASCCAQAGETVTVVLTVSNLVDPINGVQALLRFDGETLALAGVTPGDGTGSPWDSASEVHGTLNDVVYMSFVLLGGSSDADAVVATLEFTALFGGVPELAGVELVAQSTPLLTRLTDAATAEQIIPGLSGPAVVSQAGDGDADGDVDLDDYTAFDGCFGAAAPLGDCCCYDFDRDDDVDCDDWDAFVLAWTEVEPPPDLPQCLCIIPEAAVAEATVPDSGFGTRNRHLSFSGGTAGQQEGIRVRFASLPPEFAYAEGWEMWVGPPLEISESPGETGDTPTPTYYAAELQCDPHFMDWSVFDVIHVYGQAVVPSAVYGIQFVQQGCETAEVNYSELLSIVTSQWGDLVQDCSGELCGPPQGVVNFDDISSVVDKFKALPGAPKKSRADIAPMVPDHIVDFTDIPAAVDAFRGLPYPYDGPSGCR